MPKYDQWLKDFLLEKTEVPSDELPEKFAVHSIRRFLDGRERVWEIAKTYTGRLIVREGHIGTDGITVEWKGWVTHHDVDMSGVVP